MKHKYNIRVDGSKPTDEQIDGHKNFDRILADYHNLTQPIYRRPLYKNPRAFVGLVLIFVIGYLVFQAVEEEAENIALQELPVEIRDAEQRSFLTPPLSGLSVDRAEYLLAEAGDADPFTLKLTGIGELSVPRAAFITKAGQPVPLREVVLRVRNLEDPLKMIAAGVPMYTFEAEDQYLLESTVLLDLKAFRGNEPLLLADGMRLTLRLPHRNEAPDRDLQLFRLDTAARHWQRLSPGYEIRREPHPAHDLQAHRPAENDGFDLVEFDENGDPIAQNENVQSDSLAETLGYRPELQLRELGLISLNRKLRPQIETTFSVRLVDDRGEPIAVYALYKLMEGVNSVAYFWPKDKNLTYELRYLPGVNQTVFGFDAAGHLLTVSGRALENLDADAEFNSVPVERSSTPVQSIDELKQLLAGNPSQ
ncbi:MAG: hypothetical protein AAGN35_09365 [Bacteroidota bacterium]